MTQHIPEASKKIPEPVAIPEWGQQSTDHFGYGDEAERLKKRGLEDWEMAETIQESQHNVPYWFVVVFIVLLLVAVALNFPFWGDRPDNPRAWFNWGIPAAVVYCVVASLLIYWFVDYRHIRQRKKEQAAARAAAPPPPSSSAASPPAPLPPLKDA